MPLNKYINWPMNNNILVTGATGFIGTNLTYYLTKNGFTVHALVRKNSDRTCLKTIYNKIRFYTTDLSDFNQLKIISQINPSGVFHLAAANLMSGQRPRDDILIKTNFIGTINLIKALNNVNYSFFINAGSFLEYGFHNKPIKESDTCSPPEFYSLTKLSSTLYCQQAAKIYNKPILTFRIFTPYGPFIQKGRLVEQIISRALANQDIILTKPTITRDFIYVDDIVRLFLEASKKASLLQGGIFNLGSGKMTSIESLCNYILKKTKSKSKVMWDSFKTVSYDSDRWQADMQKTLNQFRWRPKYDLESGINKTISWIKSLDQN